MSGEAMPRTDGNGRELKAVLGYLLNQTVTDNDICQAIGINRNSYYARRRSADDYPNAEECRLVAKRYSLNPVDLMVLFGLLEPQDVQRYAQRYLVGKSADLYGRPMKIVDNAPTPTILEIAKRDHDMITLAPATLLDRKESTIGKIGGRPK
jgi:hypothetical protein